MKEDFLEAVFTREPGGTQKAEKIREYLLSEPGSRLSETERMELFFEAREIHLKNKILPALRQGRIVISDRFDASTYAYQAKTQSLKEQFWKLRRKVVPRDLFVVYSLLEITAEESLERKALAKGHGLNHFDRSVQNEVQGRILRYQEFFSRMYNIPHRFCPLIGVQSSESLHEQIKSTIESYFDW